MHPGDGSGPGILHVLGNAVFGDETSFDVALNGPDPGTGYSQLSLSDEIDLGGSNLTGDVGFAPTTGESFTIIHSSAPIVGEFFGLPEGGTVRLGNYLFAITYAGGGGHDVVLNPSGVVTPMVSKR